MKGVLQTRKGLSKRAGSAVTRIDLFMQSNNFSENTFKVTSQLFRIRKTHNLPDGLRITLSVCAYTRPKGLPCKCPGPWILQTRQTAESTS